jgi:hypothetical protein
MQDRQKYIEASRRCYRKNAEKRKAETREKRQQMVAWWKEYKLQFSCSQCPESHPSCIDFHHLDPNEKDTEVAYMVNHNFGKDRILREIAKCQVLCSNCHRKLHWDTVGEHNGKDADTV